MGWLEALGAGIALIIQILAVRRSHSVFIVTMVNALVYGIVFSNAHLFASAGLQALFFGLACYGLWYWRMGNDGRDVPVTRLNWMMTAAALAATGLAMAAVALVLHRYTGARQPYADTAAAGLSVLGEYLLDRKKIETWIAFAIAYGFAIYAYLASGLIFTAALCTVLLSLCVVGWISWHKQLSTLP